MAGPEMRPETGQQQHQSKGRAFSCGKRLPVMDAANLWQKMADRQGFRCTGGVTSKVHF